MEKTTMRVEACLRLHRCTKVAMAAMRIQPVTTSSTTVFIHRITLMKPGYEYWICNAQNLKCAIAGCQRVVGVGSRLDSITGGCGAKTRNTCVAATRSQSMVFIVGVPVLIKTLYEDEDHLAEGKM